MAPEILEMEGEEKEYDDKCDLWNIGVIIYQLYFKRPPYNGDTQRAILNLIKKQGNKILKKTGDNQLDDLIKSLLIADPRRRISWDGYFNHPFFKDEITLKYNIENKNEVKILGKKFVEKNKNICYIIYKNKIYELKEYFKIEEMKETLEIRIIGINRINDISYMFYECSSLLHIDGISNWNIKNINDMNFMIDGCTSLKNKPEIFNKFKEKIFEIKGKDKTDKQNIEDLFTIIHLQQKEIDNLKNDNEQFKKENNILKERIIQIENNIKELLEFKKKNEIEKK